MVEREPCRAVIYGHENEQGSPNEAATPVVSDEKKTPDSPKVQEEPEIELPVQTEKKSYLDKIKLIRKVDLKKENHLAGMAWRPLVFMTFPVIFYAGFSYGSNLCWFNVLNATSSLVLANSPYNFSPSMVGVTYVSPLVGTAIASAYTGWVGDKVLIALARRNKGILEPEHRLWLFLPHTLLLPFALILWGVGAAHHIHWFGCVFAMGVIALTNVIGLQLSISYCIDSYKDLGAEAIVTVILVRNTMSFAVNYGTTPWVTNMGLRNAFILAAFVGMAQSASLLVMVKYGNTPRRSKGPRYVKYVEQMASAGVVH
ncbi:uncharacterized protein MYCFIDRAFT_195975 [Pseudocercospora fijiensis CIRAD86]|uniref:Major facilitator superfamily (MFS) profile domain-containing protein n=1 Tax=Pseudocercospora fijiensis (strain CIRAD86) TaxID=383855 RepID=M3B716_PSEFD|nr:uncharacterized protein MYCFIDRAFT_195975 [Pseudocercospora fijiensis CIRAD86]EME85123.1 hypothetical protein MYCFIDRAFT_195975 [Pseudocercospora fijiensis CIRAD86]